MKTLNFLAINTFENHFRLAHDKTHVLLSYENDKPEL